MKKNRYKIKDTVAHVSLPAKFSNSQDKENFAISSAVLHNQDLVTIHSTPTPSGY